MREVGHHEREHEAAVHARVGVEVDELGEVRRLHALVAHVSVADARRLREPVHDEERARATPGGPDVGAAPELGDDHRLPGLGRPGAQPPLVAGRIVAEPVEVDTDDLEGRPVDLLPESGGIRHWPGELPARHGHQLGQERVQPSGDPAVEQPPPPQDHLQAQEDPAAGHHPPRRERELAADEQRDASRVAAPQLLGVRRYAREVHPQPGRTRVGEVGPDVDVQIGLQGLPGGVGQPAPVRADQHHRGAVQVLADHPEGGPDLVGRNPLDGVGDASDREPAHAPNVAAMIRVEGRTDTPVAALDTSERASVVVNVPGTVARRGGTR
ncbi:hypothetical protein K1T35_29825 [Pseudonocardia sp. DSM 110487]|uniref:hypothetical protein n=1 Tax=Pseudonocardia sp. DSM 110487 TaxID=2865833 RepID=UPI001C6A0746|nr:hypothetical protein [Pseudonocardia sp. DSM 110487]QYN32748.1 hypothetical protein K1T35_29825 [Pseudonocardia sp. DSM 110487]